MNGACARLLTLMEFYRFCFMPLLYQFKASETYVEHGFYLKQAPHILHELFTLKKVQSQQPRLAPYGFWSNAQSFINLV